MPRRTETKVDTLTARRWLQRMALFIAPLLLSATTAAAVDPIPSPTGMVNDFAHVLTDAEKQALEAKLNRLKQSSGVEIAVATIETTHGEPPFDYSMRMIRQWQVGDKERGGVLFLVVTKDRQISVRTSSHAEGAVTDGMAGEARDAAATFFRKGQWGAGLNAGVDRLIQRVEAAAASDPPPHPGVKPKQASKASPIDLVVGLSMIGLLMQALMGVAGLIIYALWRLLAGARGAPARWSSWPASSSADTYGESDSSSASCYSGSSSSGGSDEGSGGGFGGFGGDSSAGGGADGSF